jgi:hypothetical protein
MTDADDDALDAALAQALGPRADDTAPLSRAVLTRIAAETTPTRPPLAEVLAQPAPAAGLLLGGLLLAGALGYALLPGEVEDVLLLQALIGLGG